MKRFLIILVALSLLAVACTAALAQNSAVRCPQSCTGGCIADDACDNRAQDGCCRGQCGAGFTDADGDGVCDNRAQGRYGCGRRAGNCSGFGRNMGCGMRCA